jgi:hypothetical protein
MSVTQRTEQYQNSKKSFYPDVPSPKIAPTLPLLNYTGTYYHPGYHNITIFLKDGALAAIRSNLTVSPGQLSQPLNDD